jgi:hypothetical protein
LTKCRLLPLPLPRRDAADEMAAWAFGPKNLDDDDNDEEEKGEGACWTVLLAFCFFSFVFAMLRYARCVGAG